MRIEVKKEIDHETIEVYSFNLFDLTAVFVSYSRQKLHKGKKAWQVETFWDKYDERRNVIDEPVLDEAIKKLAWEKCCELMEVKAWDEWKNPKKY